MLRVAREIGYRPNDLAQSLHRAKSRTIGIISNDSFGRFTFPIVEALEERLADEGIAVFMCNATDDPARERQHLDQLLGKRIDGLVVTARRADKRPPIGPFAHGLPVVYVFSQADDPGRALPAARRRGRRACWPSSIWPRSAASASPMSPGPSISRPCGCAATAIAPRWPRPGCREIDGFYLSGRLVGGLGPRGRRAAVRRPRRAARRASSAATTRSPAARPTRCASAASPCPRDVAIVGFDNWEVMALAARPPLTSIDMNLKALGREAGDRLLDMIAGKRLQRRPAPALLAGRAGIVRRHEHANADVRGDVQ